jgi:translation initiation factor 2B subunit (eIF-2B alpha/beta/delta family)
MQNTTDPREKWSEIFKEECQYNNKYINIMVAIEDFCSKKTSEKIPTDYFTPHDKDHSKAVESIINDLIDKSKIYLTNIEKFLLFASVWTHDLGMTQEIALDKLRGEYSRLKAREIHEEISAWFLANDKEFRKIFVDNVIPDNLFRAWIHSINIISKYHRRKHKISECPKIRHLCGDEEINLRLLACLIRLADTLHVDSSRFDKKMYDILQIGNFDMTARFHWLKSYLVSAVSLDIKNQTIFITIDLPELKKDDSELRENSEKLKYFISENIFEDLEAVKDTIKEYNYEFYSAIKLEENFCPGFSEEMEKEVINILRDLNIVSAPNSSNVIQKSLKSIESLSTIEFASYELFYKNYSQFLDSLKAVSKSRPCHVGLNFIITRLDAHLGTFPGITENMPNTEIYTVMSEVIHEKNAIEKLRKDSKDEIYSKYEEKFNDKKHVFLFGYSSMVVDLLKSNKSENFKNLINLHVFECASKRRFSLANNIEYDDGIYYASELHKAGFKKISILPETSFASLLKDNSTDDGRIPPSSTNSMLLLGANGIDLEGNCGHTSGHLMMVIVANKYSIPVFVVADIFKVGKIEWKPSLKREGANWLTGKKQTLNELGIKKISTVNYREDKIPVDMIEEFLIDKDYKKKDFEDKKFNSPPADKIIDEALREGKPRLSENPQALGRIKELLAQTPRPSISQIAKEIGYPRVTVAGYVKQMTNPGVYPPTSF